jgi:cytochrome P450
MIGLLRDRPDQLEAIKADRSLVSKAIEESLRWDGPLFATARAVMRDTELAGVKIPKGALIYPVVAVANRDPQRFPDPDRFDITRPNLNQHMGFLAGPHICVGQHLARLEMVRALNILLDHFPKLRLDPDYPPPVNRGAVLRWVDHMYVRFD